MSLEMPCWALARDEHIHGGLGTTARAAEPHGKLGRRAPAGVEHAGGRAASGPCRRPTVSRA